MREGVTDPCGEVPGHFRLEEHVAVGAPQERQVRRDGPFRDVVFPQDAADIQQSRFGAIGGEPRRRENQGICVGATQDLRQQHLLGRSQQIGGMVGLQGRFAQARATVEHRRQGQISVEGRPGLVLVCALLGDVERVVETCRAVRAEACDRAIESEIVWTGLPGGIEQTPPHLVGVVAVNPRNLTSGQAVHHARVADFRRSNGVIRSNAGASLIDLGDNIACIELHSLKNAIGGDVLSLISPVLNPASDAVRDFAGFVITGDRDNFSVGANLMQLLLLAQEGEFAELNAIIHSFQQMTAAIKFCPRPVVAAPFGLTLGGGAEICLHAVRRQPHAETYIGLVEAGVGLIPAGGGTKEMLLRAVDSAAQLAPPDPRDPLSRFAQSSELATAIKRTFETIALAKVSTSAAEARTLGLLAAADRITMNRERLLLDAKAQVAALADAGYTAPQPRMQIPAPGASALATLEMGAFLMGEAGYASEHDQKVARWAAYILAGGRVTAGTPVSEQYLLDLEREAFLSLAGERKTQERIAYTLKTGKPLRN